MAQPGPIRTSRVLSLEAHAARPSRVVARLSPYDAVALRPEPGSAFFKLDWNEATVGPSAAVTGAITAHVNGGAGLNWYPALYDRELARDLEPLTGVPAGNLLVTSGSDDALRLVCDTFLDEGDVVAVPEPTYAHFVLFAKARGAVIKPLVPESPFESHLPLLLDAVRKRPRLLYLVNPNNPTGLTYSVSEIETLLRAAKNTLVIVDEAYIEFGGESVAALVLTHPNLVVTRTFSKAYGLAALRVGYLCAGAKVIEALRVLYNPKSVGTLGLVGARAAVADSEHLAWYVREVRAARQRLADWFAARGHTVFVGNGNFLLVRVDDAKSVVHKLAGANVFVRDRSHQAGLAGCFRVSIGTIEQTERLIETLRAIDV
jgi:histidinol-phosphate aminotransferase